MQCLIFMLSFLLFPFSLNPLSLPYLFLSLSFAILFDKGPLYKKQNYSWFLTPLLYYYNDFFSPINVVNVFLWWKPMILFHSIWGQIPPGLPTPIAELRHWIFILDQINFLSWSIHPRSVVVCCLGSHYLLVSNTAFARYKP